MISEFNRQTLAMFKENMPNARDALALVEATWGPEGSTPAQRLVLKWAREMVAKGEEAFSTLRRQAGEAA